jgi:hypothetical protein
MHAFPRTCAFTSSHARRCLGSYVNENWRTRAAVLPLLSKSRASIWRTEKNGTAHSPPSPSLSSYSILRVPEGRPGRSWALSGGFAGRRRRRGGVGVVPYRSSLVVGFPFVEFGVSSPNGVPPTPVGRVAWPVVVLMAAARAWCLWRCSCAPPRRPWISPHILCRCPYMALLSLLRPAVVARGWDSGALLPVCGQRCWMGSVGRRPRKLRTMEFSSNDRFPSPLSVAHGATPCSEARANSSRPACHLGGSSSTSPRDSWPAPPEVACSPVAVLTPMRVRRAVAVEKPRDRIAFSSLFLGFSL